MTSTVAGINRAAENDHKASDQAAAGEPIALAGTFALYQSAMVPPRPAAVLFLSPWGQEDMSTRKLFRIMAEDLAKEGLASLRFDYPACGDALDPTPEPPDLSVWTDAALAALACLRQRSGRHQVYLLGHGIGASLALDFANSDRDIAGIVAMAPVVSGRAYFRELQFWSRVIDDGLGLREDQRAQAPGTIAGHVMPPKIVEALRATDFSTLPVRPDCRYLVLARPERPADAKLAQSLQQQRAAVTCDAYEGFDAMVANPALPRLPLAAAEKVVRFLVDAAGPAEPPQNADSVVQHHLARDEPAILAGADFTDRALRFGDHDRLLGILCQPAPRGGLEEGARVGVLILGSAYDRQCGWGRAHTRLARTLAGQGIASFRFDSTNVADSPPAAGRGAEVLYQPIQKEDARAALDVLEQHGCRAIVAIGRCSGGYLGYVVTVADPRVKAACLANPFTFYWNPERSVEETLKAVPRPLETYVGRLFRGETFRRLLAGEIDIRKAAANFSRVALARLFKGVDVSRFLAPGQRQAHKQVRQGFDSLLHRSVPLRLLYSEGDIGLQDVYSHFGKDMEGLTRYPNVVIDVLEGVDHNFSPADAWQRYTDEIITLARSVDPERRGDGPL